MNLGEFQQQLDRCHQSPEEIRTFVQDMAVVRLKHIIGALQRLEAAAPPPAHEYQAGGWEPARVAESGIDPSWLEGLQDPGSVYLHIDTATRGDWAQAARLVGMTFLSDKQQRVLFPALSKARRPRVLPEQLSDEVRRLNALLRTATTSGMTWERYSRYQAHVGIDGASRNVLGQIGAAGGVLAVMDALEEIAPGRIRDRHGVVPPAEARTPIDIYRALYEDGVGRGLKAVLLDNGRAIVFASDPDVAIFQSLEAPYASARQAFQAWEDVRRDVKGRGQKVHQFAVGEIKTATDPQNLHERLALGSRETREEVRTDRFLMMAVLTKELLSGGGGKKHRQGPALANKDVERFSDVFNLYFAWGYDGARKGHPEHWEAFKRRLSGWCGLE